MEDRFHINPKTRPFELWAGIECTVNRVGDRYFDQMAWNGHANRLDDLDRLAALGVQAVRYPVLWEKIAPEGLDKADWSWADERLNRLRELGIRPIVGLVHHGSGPRYTRLDDPGFPDKLAAFAGAVAERYPWVDAYTPVNEILTTARFSGLYGHWYPHGRSPQLFMRILLNQVRGVQRAMQAVRQVNPGAALIQTDDLGKIYSTPGLAYQAAHENERRWLSFDLLCGRVDRTHALFDYLLSLGISETELAEIREEAEPPDILGINYYITSERFLDDRLEFYPREMHGGNGRDVYVDTEAVRACAQPPAGHAAMLGEAWDRYHLPLAATEVHLGGHPEHQLRWWMEAWTAIRDLRETGVDVRAVTAWSMLGTFHWDRLVTSTEGHYESGLFDVRSDPPRPTLLAKAVQTLAKTGTFDHPVLDAPGWWHHPSRLIVPPVNGEPVESPHRAARRSPRTLLITGGQGTLGQAFQHICEARGIPYTALTRDQLDITDLEQIERIIDRLSPWAVINAAGYVCVDDAEAEPESCFMANTGGAVNLSAICAEKGLPLLLYSSSLVFDGNQNQPYVESAPASPLNVYGLSKLEAEKWVLHHHPSALVVRTSAFFGPWDQGNFPMQVLRALKTGQTFLAAEDVVVSPTYVPDLVNASLDLLVDGEKGLWHLTNPGEVTWFDFARQIANELKLDGDCITGVPAAEMGWTAPRPLYSVLTSERAQLLPDLADALSRFALEGTGYVA